MVKTYTYVELGSSVPMTSSKIPTLVETENGEELPKDNITELKMTEWKTVKREYEYGTARLPQV